MSGMLQTTIDRILQNTVNDPPQMPGVTAVATNGQENIYEGAAGKRVLGQEAPMQSDTICAIFSTTKAITATAALQLVEQGLLDLDAPAKNYAPAIGDIQVLDKFDDEGNPVYRPPKREVTSRMLLLHIAGFGYDFFNENYARLTKDHGQESPINATKTSLQTPLLFDPGSQWEYGSNMDWLGQVVEGIAQKRLGEVFAESIFAPLDIHDTSFILSPEMRAHMALIHQRDATGALTPLHDFTLPMPPEVDMGGHGLYGTALDYCKFIRMWLNDGAGPNGQVLKADTVRMAEKNGLDGAMKINGLPAVNPALTNYAEFFPGMPKSWGMSFMINDEDAPTGRPAGSLCWAGLANLYYWIDRKNGVGGFWATQILPFVDETSVSGYLAFETALYDHYVKQQAA